MNYSIQSCHGCHKDLADRTYEHIRMLICVLIVPSDRRPAIFFVGLEEYIKVALIQDSFFLVCLFILLLFV